MSEGPTIVLLKEEVKQFTGKKIITISGNSKIEQKRMLDLEVISFRSWGKHFLICFEDFTLRVHFLMYGSYAINFKKDRQARLNLTFATGEINLYSCSIIYLEGDINTLYDWSADVMDNEWNQTKAIEKLKEVPNELICDALLEQDIFSGVGNIIKNEVLYRVGIHPDSIVEKIPALKLEKLIEEARNYSFQFLD